MLRELGLPLDAVGRVLDGTTDRARVLRDHRERLLQERERLARLADSVSRTIEELEGGEPMDPAEMFDGFDADRQQHYEAELVRRYGDHAREAIAESQRRVGAMSAAEAASLQTELAERDQAFAALLDAGVPADDPRAQEVTAGHYAWVCRFWTPDADAFAGLGDLYVDSPDFRDRYDAVRPGLAEYVRDAMTAYAVTSLAGPQG